MEENNDRTDIEAYNKAMRECEHLHTSEPIFEPEVWIEYQRINLDKDNFARQSWADAIHRYNLMPDGCRLRTRTESNETIWEYLV